MRNRRDALIAGKTSFKARFGRLDFFRLLVRWPVSGFLSRVARRHLQSGHRQMVIFCFDHIGHEINIDGVYEKELLDALFDWFKHNSIETTTFVALDIGANIGNHSLYFAKHFREVLAFEPNPRTFKVLCLNADLASNITCHQFGLSSRAGPAMLAVEKGNTGAAFVSAGAEFGVPIALNTLDSIDGVRNVRLIKIDVEGHELEVLKGGRGLLIREQPIVLLEQHRQDFSDGHSSAIAFLQELGYQDFAILEKIPKTDGNAIKKFLLAPLQMLCFGRSIKVEVVDYVKPGDYTFIVALPDWFFSSKP